tara:strand:+ start:843 stop:1193 length:351 start_codon:yes stop_codon:yes gene_type:complete
MRKYKYNIHLSKRETGILENILRKYIDEQIIDNKLNKIENLTRIKIYQSLFIKLNKKAAIDHGWMTLDWKYIFERRKKDLIQNAQDKLLQIQSGHTIKAEYEDIHHFNSYERLKNY